jgi:Do/DeqQ family serine protease
MSSVSPSGNQPRKFYALAAVLVLVGLVIGLGVSAVFDLQKPSIAQRAELHATTSSAPIPESPFVSVVDKALPAVVFIDVRKAVSASNENGDDLLRRFFGDGSRQQQPRTRPSSGSGFIIDREGHVLTNNHVVRDASEITVTLNDKRQFKAKVVGTDPETDIAVIKIEGSNLPVLPLGDSDQIRVGDWAIAIGNPLGELKGSVTVGIISARGRSNLNIWGGTPGFQDFIQTDASINFGNSGGPLCNIRGEAIGVNTAINPSGQGIGFAIPINLTRHVAEQLVANGSVQRAMLGVYLAELTPEIADGFGYDKNMAGVLIQNVMEGSPAQRAGLQRNDVIVEFDGVSVKDLQKFRLRVAEQKVGTSVPVKVLRSGKPMNLTVKLVERDTQFLASNTPRGGNQSEPEANTATLAGLTVRPMTRTELSEAGIKAGVVISNVEPGSPADDAGLQAGDLIEEVGGKGVSTADDFEKQIKSAQSAGRHAVLLVNRGGNTQFVPLRVGG